MSFMQMFILALVQGISEFIPVSSSGHLVILQEIMELSQPGVTLEVMLHFGTLMAVIVVFRHDIAGLIKGFLSLIGIAEKHPYEKLLLMVLIASLPAAILGLTFYGHISSFFSNASYAYFFLIINGFYLMLNRFFSGGKISLASVGPFKAIIIGLSQVFTMLPGISRSGTTITTGILVKLDREAAARFSFLMSIPAVAGATLYEARSIQSLDSSLSLLLAGVVISFVSGYIAIKILLKLILAKKLHYFGYYCLFAGMLGLVFLK